MEIKEVFPGRRRDRRLFAGLPFVLAKGIDPWHPGIRSLSESLVHPGKNPYWREHRGSFFVALRGGRVLGRMGVVDPGTIPDRPEAAVLAMPDFVDDPSVVSALLEAVETRARQRGAKEILGPMNPNIHHDVGIQVDGFQRPNAIFMGYQPPYYQRHLEAERYVGLVDFQAWGLYQESFLREGRLRRIIDRVERKPAFRIRTVRMDRFDEDLEIFFHLYSESFSDHWGFVRPTWEEFRFIAKDIRYILRPPMALVAEWEGEPVGFVLGVPDLLKVIPKTAHGRLTPGVLFRMWRRWESVDEVRVMIAGVLPTHRRFGIHLPLFYRTACNIFDLGFRGGEISWVLKDNAAMGRALPLLGASPMKCYRLYHKPLP